MLDFGSRLKRFKEIIEAGALRGFDRSGRAHALVEIVALLKVGAKMRPFCNALAAHILMPQSCQFRDAV